MDVATIGFFDDAAGMRLPQLSAVQLEKLREQIWSKLCYLKQLRVRNEEKDFPKSDRFYCDIEMAEVLLRDSIELVESAWDIASRRSPRKVR